MRVMHSTPQGTISAKRHSSGISVGIYGHQSIVSVEHMEGEDIVLLVNDQVAEHEGIKVIHVDNDWCPKGIAQI